MRARLLMEMDVELVDGIEPTEAARTLFRYHGELPARVLFKGLRVMDIRELEPWEGAGDGEAPYDE